MLISLLGVMAANESRLLSSRIKSGKMSKARENKAFGGKITGYKKSSEGKPIIDEKEAPIVRRIFELASQSIGMRLISDAIEKEFNKKIQIGTLSGIIKNTFYKGERKYNDLILQVEPIVTEKIWESANEYISSRKKFSSRVYAHVNLVQGKINCGLCGNVMYQTVIKSARTNSFICKKDKCRNRINRPWLFIVVREVVERYAKHHLDKGVREKIQLNIKIHEARIINNRKELKKCEERKYKIYEDFYDDNITKESRDRLIKRTTESNDKLKIEIKNFSEKVSKAKSILKKNISHFDNDLETFKIQIENILNKIIVWDDNVEISVFGLTSLVDKPKPSELGWFKRRNQKPKFTITTFGDEELQMMIDNAIEENN